MSQLLFEIQMFFAGLLALIQAIPYWFVNGVASATGAFLTLALVIIGFGLLMKAIPLMKLFSNLFIILGILMFVLGMFLRSILGYFSYPYGHDSIALINSMGEQLLAGRLHPSSAKAMNTNDSLFWSAPTGPQGHRYLSLNLLPCVQLEPDEAALAAGEDLNRVFPIRAAGRSGKAVQEGNEFLLGQLPLAGGNPVRSSNIHGHYFSLIATPDHWLRGTAHHGFIRDRQGKLWLFQYGLGPMGEAGWKQLFNYPVAKLMWMRMAENTAATFKNCSGNPAPLPGGAGSPQPKNAPRRTLHTIIWNFDHGSDSWEVVGGTIANRSGVLWLAPSSSKARLVSPAFSVAGSTGIELQLGLASNCNGPLEATWTAGGKLFRADTVTIPTQACTQCVKARFFEYRTSVAVPGNFPAQLSLKPCSALDSRTNQDKVGLDYVRIDW